MDAAIPADAQNAPTGIWKSRTEREIPTAPPPIIVVVNERKNNGDSNSVAKPSTESDQAHLERRRGVLVARPTVAPQPLLHPNIGEELYRTKVVGLRDALSKRESRSQAADLLRGFVDEIRLTPTEDGPELAVAVKGNLAGVLAVAGLPSAASCGGCGGGI